MLIELHLHKSHNPDKKTGRCLNKSSDKCFLCDETKQLEYHHIVRIPTITIKVCKPCHKKIDLTKEYDYLKPEITARGMKFIKWYYNNIIKES